MLVHHLVDLDRPPLCRGLTVFPWQPSHRHRRLQPVAVREHLTTSVRINLHRFPPHLIKPQNVYSCCNHWHDIVCCGASCLVTHRSVASLEPAAPVVALHIEPSARRPCEPSWGRASVCRSMRDRDSARAVRTHIHPKVCKTDDTHAPTGRWHGAPPQFW